MNVWLHGYIDIYTTGDDVKGRLLDVISMHTELVVEA
jgi:hypothetical protein